MVIESNCGEVLKHVKRLVKKVTKPEPLVEEYDEPTTHHNYFSIRTPKNQASHKFDVESSEETIGISKGVQT